MKFTNPLPQPLPKECLKAAKIFKSFVDSGNNGLDGVIPRQVLENAKGFAIFTIIKAGFLFSARAGSGVVIAKLDDGTWSAPSAIGTAGLGVGGQAGAEMTDFLVVLNSRSAVRSFMSAGSLTLGGNMSIAIGPLGRNGEALGSLNTSGKVAAMYSYSKTRGLFGGVSIEGSVIVERQDANATAYQSDVSAKQLLSGAIEPPQWAQPLIKTLEACVGMPGGRKWINDAPTGDSFSSAGPGSRNSGYAFGAGAGIASPDSELPPSLRRKKNSASSVFPPTHWGKRKEDGSYFTSDLDDGPINDFTDHGRASIQRNAFEDSKASGVAKLIDDGSASNSFPTHFDSDFTPPSPEANTTSFSRPAHRLTQSLQSPPSHTLSFNPDSPFNDLPPFPSNLRSQDSFGHNRSVNSTSPSYQNGNRIRAKSNPFSGLDSSRGSDPFSKLDDNFFGRARTSSVSSEKPRLLPKAGLSTPLRPNEGVGRAIALYTFNAVEPGDLSFKKGDVIIITKKTDKTDDWWTGKIEGREGIFPANFVEVV